VLSLLLRRRRSTYMMHWSPVSSWAMVYGTGPTVLRASVVLCVVRLLAMGMGVQLLGMVLVMG
jgi:hypothetical protein